MVISKSSKIVRARNDKQRRDSYHLDVTELPIDKGMQLTSSRANTLASIPDLYHRRVLLFQCVECIEIFGFLFDMFVWI